LQEGLRLTRPETRGELQRAGGELVLHGVVDVNPHLVHDVDEGAHQVLVQQFLRDLDEERVELS
jgi:hypothetical protein